jgi:6-phosphogluconolactonase
MNPSLSAPSWRVYLGTYTDTGSRGILTARFDGTAGAFGAVTTAAETPNPSFLAFTPGRDRLLAVNEGPAGLAAYRILDDGGLGPAEKLTEGLLGPCDVAADPSGRMAAVANYRGGSVVALRLDAGGGPAGPARVYPHSGCGVHPTRQRQPHAHGVTFSPDGAFLLVPDLGIDRVVLYRVDAAQARLTPHPAGDLALRPGSGPRHAAFAPEGRHVYVINELASTLTAAEFDPAGGRLREIQTVTTLPDDFRGESTTAEVEVSRDGRFVYGSNRGHDSIAVFARDLRTGRLRAVEHVSTRGRTPRHFALSPDGRWLVAANQDSDSLAVFAVDESSGRLTPASMATGVHRPVCVRFLASR